MGSSDIVVLQALVIYLMSMTSGLGLIVTNQIQLTMRQDLDSRTLWTFQGVATRVAQGMGVHRDGTFLGLAEEPPAEKTGATEIIACLLRCEVRIFWETKLAQMGRADQDLTRAM